MDGLSFIAGQCVLLQSDQIDELLGRIERGLLEWKEEMVRTML